LNGKALKIDDNRFFYNEYGECAIKYLEYEDSGSYYCVFKFNKSIDINDSSLFEDDWETFSVISIITLNIIKIENIPDIIIDDGTRKVLKCNENYLTFYLKGSFTLEW
jgi:hypothetical protein